jgi:predicted transglutaminase-like cysteine proteinase
MVIIMVEPGESNCHCGSTVAGGSRFCPSCGAPQAPQVPAIKFCPNCGTQNAAASSFCPQCGTNLRTPWTPPYQPAPPIEVHYYKRSGQTAAVVAAVAIVAILILAAVVASGMLSSGPSGSTRVADGEFTWTFEGRRYSLNITISTAAYEEYRNDPIQRYAYTIEEAVSMCDGYVTPEDPVIQELAGMLGNYSATFSELRTANFVLSFVQSIDYVEDDISVSRDEYWRFPVETLYDEMGDCEDKAFLYASIMEAMGYDAVILLFDGHAAAGISVAKATGSYYQYDGHNYFYCETTASGWRVGNIPDEYGDAYVAQVS